MMLKKTIQIAILTALYCVNASANSLDSVINEGVNRADDNATSHHRIEKLADETDAKHEEYRQLGFSLTNLKIYNTLLSKQVDDQKTRIDKLQLSLKNTAQMQREILPLIEEMVESLAQFVHLDMPFLSRERSSRIKKLEHLINESAIDIAEKYRQVTEAYQIEMEYGRTIESYRDTLNIDNTERELTVLRIGRIALLYRSDDGQYLGVWNKNSKSWQPLDASEYERSIKNGIAIALKKKAPSLITTPIITYKNPA